MDIILTH